MTFIISTQQSGTRTLATADLGLITATGILLDGNVSVANAVLLNHGIMFSYFSNVLITAAGAYIENHGSMTGGDGAGVIDAFTNGAAAASVQLVNHGTMTALSTTNTATDTGVFLAFTGGHRIYNYGTMTASGDSVIEIVELAAGTGNLIVNTGLIQCATGIATIRIENNDADRLENTGQIIGGIDLVSGNDVIVNSGRIDGNITFGATGNMELVNSGTITGDVTFNGSNATVTNAGAIVGRLNSFGGADRFDLRGGTVTDGVYDFGGNDTYLIDNANIDISDNDGVIDTVFSWVSYALGTGIERLFLQGTAVEGRGNAQSNEISGTAMDNRLVGDDGLDTISGEQGDDWIDGGTDADNVYGGGGDDDVRGRLGADMLFGDDGDDWLHGGAAADSLYGGSGEDTLIGSSGRDRLEGGIDADTFIFQRASDIGLASGNRDIIVGFETGLDLIDLSVIDASVNAAGNQAFTFIGAGAFTGVAGQLQLLVSGNTRLLSGDVDGVGGADFTLQINNATVVAADLIL
ncbi:MAG: calcium-binding protein [Paracoccaceae bacterium]